MCGRLTLQTTSGALAALFDGLKFPTFKPRYNICPTQPVACVRLNDESEKEVANLRWGLVPGWAKDLKIGARMINARAETVASKPAFRSAFKKRRCLVVADGFYEWKKAGKSKQPFYISRADTQPFVMAGLWESWSDKSDPSADPIETCSVITTTANALMGPLHDRMPVILEQKEFEFWLDKEFTDHEYLESLLVPFEPDELQAFPVDTIVNKAANDVPQCIEPIDPQANLLF